MPRKGLDTLIRASVVLRKEFPDLTVAIAGSGRDSRRLTRLIAELGAPVTLLGQVPDDDLVDLYTASDAFSMLCRSRWLGLEQEGFGIVFVEAAAAGVAQVAGRSGGAHEAVDHATTGLIVDDPRDATAAAEAIATILRDPVLADDMASASRQRAELEFNYDVLAARLHDAIKAIVSP